MLLGHGLSEPQRSAASVTALSVSEHPAPHLDDRQWADLIEAIGPDSIRVLICHWMGDGLKRSFQPEDVLQETLLHAWRDRGSHRWSGLRAFRGWVLAIARHRLCDLSDIKRPPVFLSEIPLRPDESSPSAHLPCVTTEPGRLAALRERAEVMRAALAALPADHAYLVRRHLFEEVTMERIASELGVKLGTAWYRFRKAAKLYADQLAAFGSAIWSGSGSRSLRWPAGHSESRRLADRGSQGCSPTPHRGFGLGGGESARR